MTYYYLGYTIYYSFNKVIIPHIYNNKLILVFSWQLENYNKCNKFAIMISRQSDDAKSVSTQTALEALFGFCL